MIKRALKAMTHSVQPITWSARSFRIKTFSLLVVFILWVSASGGCAVPPTAQPTPTAPPQPTLTRTQTLTPSPTLTPTPPAPSQTSTPTLTPTPTVFSYENRQTLDEIRSNVEAFLAGSYPRPEEGSKGTFVYEKGGEVRLGDAFTYELDVGTATVTYIDVLGQALGVYRLVEDGLQGYYAVAGTRNPSGRRIVVIVGLGIEQGEEGITLGVGKHLTSPAKDNPLGGQISYSVRTPAEVAKRIADRIGEYFRFSIPLFFRGELFCGFLTEPSCTNTYAAMKPENRAYLNWQMGYSDALPPLPFLIRTIDDFDKLGDFSGLMQTIPVSTNYEISKDAPKTPTPEPPAASTAATPTKEN